MQRKTRLYSNDHHSMTISSLHVQYVHRIPSVLDCDKYCSTGYTVPYQYELPWLKATSGTANVYMYSYNKNQPDALICQIYFWNKTLHVSDTSSFHQQKFFAVHTAMVCVIQVCWHFASKLSASPYDIYRGADKFLARPGREKS